MNNHQLDVCIVGAGPAGAFLGYLLAKQGIRTLLVERHGELDREFRGEHLNGDVAEMLKKYGVFDKVQEKGILPLKAVEFYNGRFKVMSITPELFGIEHVGIHFPHKHLLSVLVDEAKQTGAFDLLMNTAVTGLIIENGKVVGLKAKHGGEELEIRASVVVGADGRYSTVRKLAEIPTDIRKHGYDILWAKIPSPAGWAPTMRMVLAKGTQISLFANTGGFVQIGWQISEGSFPQLRTQSFQPFIQILVKAAPELASSIQEHIRDWSDFMCLPVQSSRSETWVKDGLVIMGDAAHTMSPSGGVGVNCAMKDADVLAPILLDAVRNGDCSATKLYAFEQTQRDEIHRLQDRQIKQEKIMKKLNNSWLLKQLFYWNMLILDKMPWKGKIFIKLYAARK